MSLNKHDLQYLQPRLMELAVRAGDAILEIYEGARHDGDGGRSARLEDKNDDSPLTLADLAAHDMICEGLQWLTPHIPVVSEEDEPGHYRESDGCFWLIDPLDGTKEFLAFNGEFTVNIALICAGTPQFGVVYAPALNEMYWGGRHFGAYRKRASGIRALHVSLKHPQRDTVRVVASKSHLNAETREFIARFTNTDLVQAGSSLKFCRVAEGNADIYPRLAPTCEWDTAAAQAVLEGAGGHVFDVHGSPLRYGKADVLNPFFIASAAPFAALPMQG
jgi:3'(2'), 5'-bisphosphate nucleotidase